MASGLGLLRGQKSGSRMRTGVRVVSRQQWTPDLVEEIAAAETVLFVDCSVCRRQPGSVSVVEVMPAAEPRAGRRITRARPNCWGWRGIFSIPCPAPHCC